MERTDRRAPGPFTTRFYNDDVAGERKPMWHVVPESVIVSPAPEAHVDRSAAEILINRLATVARKTRITRAYGLELRDPERPEAGWRLIRDPVNKLIEVCSGGRLPRDRSRSTR
jgi:hypothetical protein